MTSYPCPACGGDAVLCTCGALPLEDQRRLVDALQHEFRDVAHAVNVAFSTVDSKNILHLAAKRYVFRNAPDDIREAFQRTFEKTAGVQADAYGPNDERYFNIETVAKVLGLTVEETEAKARKWLGPDALKPRDDISLVN